MYAERLPPHDLEAEEAIVGSLLLDGSAIVKVAHVVKPEDFYGEKNRYCYQACLELFQRSEAINQVTLAHQLGVENRLEELGGPAYLSHLVATVPTPLHIEHYARLVSRCAVLRGLIEGAARIATMGYEDTADIEGLLNRAEDVLFRVRARQPSRDFVSLRDVLDRYLEDQAAVEQPLERMGASVPTGFWWLDELLGNLQRSDLVILAARPAMGKSTLAINIARHAAGVGAACGFFSLEMSSMQLAMRLLASEGNVDSRLLRLGLLTEAQENRVTDAVGTLSDLPIYIDDTPVQGIVEIRSKARRLALEREVDLLVVDYMQQIRSEGRSQNRVQEMSEISAALKGLARDLNVPVVAVSQLSRAPLARPSHRPQLTDLRESGSIEQDADVVLFIHRDDYYYTQEEWEQREERPYPKNITEIILAKHRHGPTGTGTLYFEAARGRFKNLPSEQELSPEISTQEPS
ncbi:MAG: replicative DNA helicase [Dehalococcoidia bacterium]